MLSSELKQKAGNLFLLGMLVLILHNVIFIIFIGLDYYFLKPLGIEILRMPDDYFHKHYKLSNIVQMLTTLHNWLPSIAIAFFSVLSYTFVAYFNLIKNNWVLYVLSYLLALCIFHLIFIRVYCMLPPVNRFWNNALQIVINTIIFSILSWILVFLGRKIRKLFFKRS